MGLDIPSRWWGTVALAAAGVPWYWWQYWLCCAVLVKAKQLDGNFILKRTAIGINGKLQACRRKRAKRLTKLFCTIWNLFIHSLIIVKLMENNQYRWSYYKYQIMRIIEQEIFSSASSNV